nr:transposase (putative), gypsy type [Tanacetum cinerariifolium]
MWTSPERNVTCADYSEAAGITRAKSETEEVNSGLKRKRATSGDGAGSSKRVRHVILGDSASTEGESMDALPTTAAKNVTETPPSNPHPRLEPSQLIIYRMEVERQGPRCLRKDEEIALLKAQLADARVEAVSARSYAHKLAEEKMSLLVQLDQERASSADHRASCHWVVKYVGGAKNNHFAGLEEFRQEVKERLEKQEGKLRKLSIEYDEELYPHLVSSIAERRWLISHGLRLAAMCTLESQEVKQSFGDVV